MMTNEDAPIVRKGRGEREKKYLVGVSRDQLTVADGHLFCKSKDNRPFFPSRFAGFGDQVVLPCFCNNFGGLASKINTVSSIGIPQNVVRMPRPYVKAAFRGQHS